MRIKDTIYDFLIKRGTDGATDEQIQTSLNIAPDSERPARISLVKDKWVVDSGLKRLVPNSNRRARVWIAIRGRNVSKFDTCSTCGGTGKLDFGIGITPCMECKPDEWKEFLDIDSENEV